MAGLTEAGYEVDSDSGRIVRDNHLDTVAHEIPDKADQMTFDVNS